MDQEPPKGDARYRVHRSVKCYVAELMVGTAGATWYFDDSAERVVHRFPDGSLRVQYRTRFHRLQSAERMAELVSEQLARDGALRIGGKHISLGEDCSFEPYEFIDITAPEEHERAKAIFAAR